MHQRVSDTAAPLFPLRAVTQCDLIYLTARMSHVRRTERPAVCRPTTGLLRVPPGYVSRPSLPISSAVPLSLDLSRGVSRFVTGYVSGKHVSSAEKWLRYGAEWRVDKLAGTGVNARRSIRQKGNEAGERDRCVIESAGCHALN